MILIRLQVIFVAGKLVAVDQIIVEENAAHAGHVVFLRGCRRNCIHIVTGSCHFYIFILCEVALCVGGVMAVGGPDLNPDRIIRLF